MSSICMLADDYLILRDFWPYGIIFTNVCVVINIVMALLLRDLWPYVFYLYVGWLILRDFGPYWVLFMTVFVALHFFRRS
jgi:hypothetical protein